MLKKEKKNKNILNSLMDTFLGAPFINFALDIDWKDATLTWIMQWTKLDKTMVQTAVTH